MPTRRTMLAMLGALGATACGRSTMTMSSAPRSPDGRDHLTISYGDNASQVADLYLPAGGRRAPIAVVIHGGFWLATYGKELARPLAADLADHGYVGYAIEYRRVGNGGGWPMTFTDVAAAIDALAGPNAAHDRLDLDRVVAVGHSAGGHLALWAASRDRLPEGAPGAAPDVSLIGAVSQAGVVDLAQAARDGVGGGSVMDVMGAEPAEAPERYQLASPIERLPLGVPVSLVHGERDNVVPISQSERYADAARAAGDDVMLRALPDIGHFEVIDPSTDAWATCRAELDRLVAGG